MYLKWKQTVKRLFVNFLKKNGFYLIRWTSTEGKGVNHFVCNIGDGWTWEAYKNCMQKAGFYDEFEGF